MKSLLGLDRFITEFLTQQFDKIYQKPKDLTGNFVQKPKTKQPYYRQNQRY